MNDRMDKINELLKRELGKMIVLYLGDSIASITEVDTGRDLSNSKVYIVTLNDDKKVVDKLNHNAKEIGRAHV